MLSLLLTAAFAADLTATTAVRVPTPAASISPAHVVRGPLPALELAVVHQRRGAREGHPAPAERRPTALATLAAELIVAGGAQPTVNTDGDLSAVLSGAGGLLALASLPETLAAHDRTSAPWARWVTQPEAR
jgi:hypothetical protein